MLIVNFLPVHAPYDGYRVQLRGSGHVWEYNNYEWKCLGKFRLGVG